MGLLEKLQLSNIIINSKNQSKMLSNWDSRKSCIRADLDKTEVSIVQDLFHTFDCYTTYKNCFLNNIFLSEIAIYLMNEKKFINCEFEISNLLKCSSILLDAEFKNCTFYISDYDNNSISFDIKPELKMKLYSNNNVVYKKSYIEYLAEKYKNNLNKVKKDYFKGICLNHADLSRCELPNDRDFFKDLSDNNIHHLKLPNIDLNNYDLSNTTLSYVSFSKDSILSVEAMKNGIFNSNLPKLDFTKIDSNYYNLLRFYNCNFDEDTIFPKDLDFFTKCIIRNSNLPTYDYSNYKIKKDTFYKCSFSEKSKLPESLFTSDYISCIEDFEDIPSSYLERIIILSQLKKPTDFYKRYINKLSNKEVFMLSKKYSLN